MKSNIKKFIYILLFVIIITIISGYIYNTYIAPETIEGFEDGSTQEPDQSAADQSVPDQAATDQAATDQSAADISATETTTESDKEPDLDKIVESLDKSAKLISDNTNKFVDSVNKLGGYVSILTREPFSSDKPVLDDNTIDDKPNKKFSEKFSENFNENEEDKDEVKPIKEGFTQKKNEYKIQGYDSYLYDGYYMKL
jgi:hypothetical protein